MPNFSKQNPGNSSSPVYQIRIKGHLNCNWSEWFGDLTITLEENGDSLLTGPVKDQAALYGLLRKTRDLGMPLISVTPLTDNQTATAHLSMEKMMKAVIYKEYGAADVLKAAEVEKPTPKDNEVLIRNYATTVTSGDVHLRMADPFIARFLTGLIRPKNPILGVDFAGEVEAVGVNVTAFKKGDRVFGSTEFKLGCYAEYVCVAADGLIALKPENLSYEKAAAIFFGGNTALHFLKQGSIQAGQNVLIYGASGSVGTYAVQLAKFFGAEVTGVCSTANVELVKSLGADKVLDYTREDLMNSRESYDIVFDTVGKSPFFASVNMLKKNGHYLRTVHMALSSILKGLWTGLTSSKKVIGGVAAGSVEHLTFLKELAETEKIKPVIDRQYPLEQTAEAHGYVEKGHKRGNVVIKIQ